MHDYKKKDRRPLADQNGPINPKEAALVLAGNVVSEDQVCWVSSEVIAQIMGANWGERLGAIRLKNVEREHRKDRVKASLVALDETILEGIALSPIEPEELSLMVSARFKRGAYGALHFMETRLGQAAQDQHINILESMVEKFLGPVWKERLEVTELAGGRHLTYKSTTDPETGGAQASFPIREVMEHAGEVIEQYARVQLSREGLRSQG